MINVLCVILGVPLGIGLFVHLLGSLFDNSWVPLSGFFGCFIPGRQYRKFKRFGKEKNAPEFTYQQIKTFVSTAPSKWRMDYDKSWNTYQRHWELAYKPDDNFYTDTRYVSLKSFYDFLMVRLFFKAKERADKKQKNNIATTRNTAEMIAFMRQDAANAQNEADKLIASQEKELKEIFSMLNNKNTTATS